MHFDFFKLKSPCLNAFHSFIRQLYRYVPKLGHQGRGLSKTEIRKTKIVFFFFFCFDRAYDHIAVKPELYLRNVLISKEAKLIEIDYAYVFSGHGDTVIEIKADSNKNNQINKAKASGYIVLLPDKGHCRYEQKKGNKKATGHRREWRHTAKARYLKLFSF